VAGPLNDGKAPREATVLAGEKQFTVRVRIDTPREAEYFRHGGILQYVLRQLLRPADPVAPTSVSRP
jgi:aconitate hydratase